jgi:TPR repeat protein
MKQFIALLLWCVSSFAVAQIEFKMGNVEIKQRALKPSDVRHFLDRKEYKNAKELALQCFKETGDAWCEYYAGSLTYGVEGLEPNQAEGLRLIRSAASKEVSSAQVFIGNLHFNGAGVSKSASEAISWWTRGANNCNAWAQNALARVYFDGEHAKKDVVEAYYWIAQLPTTVFRMPTRA